MFTKILKNGVQKPLKTGYNRTTIIVGNLKKVKMKKLIFCLCFLIASVTVKAKVKTNLYKSQLPPNRDSISFSSEKRNHEFDIGDTLYTSSGYKFYANQVLKIGAGSGEKGYFKYIFLVSANNTDMTYVGTFFQSVDKQILQGSSSTGLTSARSTIKTYNSNVDLTRSMAPTSAGKEYVIVNLKKTGSKNIGYSYSPVIAEPIDGIFGNKKGKLKLGSERFYIDYENAVNSGELIYPGKQQNNKNQTSIEVKVIQEKNQGTSITDELAKLKKLYDSGAITKEEYEAGKKKLLDKL